MDKNNVDIVAAILAAPYLGPSGMKSSKDSVPLFRDIRDDLIKLIEEERGQPQITVLR